MGNAVQEALALVAEAQREAEREAQDAYARNHRELAEEMQAKLLGLSLLTNELHASAGLGVIGGGGEALNEDQVSERKRCIMQIGGFRI